MDEPTHLIEYETMLLSRHRPRAFLWAEHEGCQLERSAYFLLRRLQMEGLMSIGQLSEATGLEVSTLNRQTSAMLRGGLVERIPDPEGGMARKFRISAEGERRLDAHREANIRGLEKVLTDWSPEDLAAFAAYLTRFNADIESLEGRPWPHPTEEPTANGEVAADPSRSSHGAEHHPAARTSSGRQGDLPDQ